MAVSLLLAAGGGRGLQIEITDGTAVATACREPGFEDLRLGIPAARALPLLLALAQPGPATLNLEGLDGMGLALHLAAA